MALIDDPQYRLASNLLHSLWTKAVDGPEYDKSQWIELERQLNDAFLRASLSSEDEDLPQEQLEFNNQQLSFNAQQLLFNEGISQRLDAAVRRIQALDQRTLAMNRLDK